MPSKKSPSKISQGTPARRRSEKRLNTRTSATADFPIVGIGGSAGGLESASNILRALPANPGFAVVMLQHLAPDGPNRLSAYFQRSTKLPVLQIKDGMRVEINHVYVIPAAAFVEISRRTLRLVERQSATKIYLPIDHFFHSLAHDEGPRAVGVVLSGLDSDGSIGLTAIKAEGGVTFAEADRTARHVSMPHNAVDTGCVDAVLTPEDIASQLVEIAQLPRPPLQLDRDASPDEAEDKAEAATSPEITEHLKRIFVLLRQQTGVDFTRYKQTTVYRRLTRRLLLNRMDRLDAYAELLRTQPDEVQALFNDLLINVTSFFRDKQVFQALSRKIIPQIIKTRQKLGGDIRIWIPGCATGQEVYSIAIVVMECLRKSGAELRVQIFGTDLSEDAIATARAGIYPSIAVKDIPMERLRGYFQKVNGNYQVSRLIRDRCTFARQNLCQDPPFSRLDLISCRNVLIYFGTELQKRCFPVFHYALQPGGFLLLGPAETISQSPILFALVDKRNKIYAKESTPQRPQVHFGKATVPVNKLNPKTIPLPKAEATAGSEIERQADRLILANLAPAGVVTDEYLQVLQFRGETAPFLEHRAGDASLHLLQMVRPSLAVDLRALTHKALKTDTLARGEGLISEYLGEKQLVDVDVLPYRVPSNPRDRWLLVLFRSRSFEDANATKSTIARGAAGKPQRELLRVREELRATKESLQAIIEEQEATNEELKSANEEIESSNEELQSSNEELETAKEELQSTNEELHTLNEELNTRNLETVTVNNDLQNLLASINLPIVMVDNALTIRRSTPFAEKLFNLIPSDVGRKLTDIKSNLDLPDLEKRIRKVIETLETQEHEVHDKAGRTYSLRIRPYRTRDHKIDGAVITVVDVEDILKSRPNRENLRRSVEVLADTLREPVLLLLPDLRICAANRSFRETYHFRKKDLQDRSLFDIDEGRWDFAELRAALDASPPPHRKVSNIEAPRLAVDIDERPLLISGCSFPVGTDSILLLTFSHQAKNEA